MQRLLFLFCLTAILFSGFLLTSGAGAQTRSRCDSTLSPSQQATLDGLIQKEFALEDMGQFDSAIQVNLQVLDICPNFAAAMTAIAGLYGRQGKYNTEIDWASKAIASDSGFINAYVNLADAYGLLGKNDMARKTLMNAISRKPENPEPYYTMGVIDEADSNWTDALKWYDKSIQADSMFEDAIYNEAMIHARMGEKQIAIDYLRRVLKIEPADAQAKEMIEVLKADLQNEQSAPSK
jgi:tetratricopeptide (TPR) repeat protein